MKEDGRVFLSTGQGDITREFVESGFVGVQGWNADCSSFLCPLSSYISSSCWNRVVTDFGKEREVGW